MIEIKALRALVDEKGQDLDAQREIEQLRKQLTAAHEKLNSQDEERRADH